MTSRKGFTLIELLIVVAIIGILAAIAIPNFLQAQTRAKVARVVAEVRTLSLGLELYHVDYNDYPLNWYDTLAHPTWHAGMHPNLGLGMHYSKLCLWLLTTPIDYLPTVNYDEPFPHYSKYNPGYWYAHTDTGLYWYQPYKWGLVSRGAQS